MATVTPFSVLTTTSRNHGTNNEIRFRFSRSFFLLSKENILFHDGTIYSLCDDGGIKDNDGKKAELELAFNLDIKYFTLRGIRSKVESLFVVY
jgi:hypothetical protein